MKRAAAFLLVLAAVVAVQAEPGVDEATGVPESDCYRCHFQGGAGVGPTLREMFRVAPAAPLTIAPGEEADLVLDVRNWWVAELGPVRGLMDLRDAPAFAFADEPAPVLDQSQRGDLPFVAADVLEPERSSRTTIQVPIGGSDLHITLLPDRTDGDQAPDLFLRVWAPHQDPDQDAPVVVQSGGPGQSEVYHSHAFPVADGAWTLEVVQSGVALGSLDLDQSWLADQGFRLSWDLLFDHADPVRFAGSDVVLDGQDLETEQATTITWRVRLEGPITQTQRIQVFVDANAHYVHPPQFGASDDWLYRHGRLIEVFAPTATPNGDNGTTPVVIGGGTEPPGPDLQTDFGTPMSTWSEIVGYGAAFLLVVSMVTGGAFGDWTRRLQERFPFRRAKRRVAYHNLVSYALIVFAFLHMVLFLVEPRFPWSVGFLLGTVSILGMVLAGVTGAFQQGMVRTMGYGTWRWLHYLSFVLAFSGAAAHMVLDGIHFTDFQERVGWEDPARPWLDRVLPPATSVQ